MKSPIGWQTLVRKPCVEVLHVVVDQRDARVVWEEIQRLHHAINLAEFPPLFILDYIQAFVLLLGLTVFGPMAWLEESVLVMLRVAKDHLTLIFSSAGLPIMIDLELGAQRFERLHLHHTVLIVVLALAPEIGRHPLDRLLLHLSALLELSLSHIDYELQFLHGIFVRVRQLQLLFVLEISGVGLDHHLKRIA